MNFPFEKNLTLPAKVLSERNQEFKRLNHLKRGQQNHTALLTGNISFALQIKQSPCTTWCFIADYYLLVIVGLFSIAPESESVK